MDNRKTQKDGFTVHRISLVILFILHGAISAIGIGGLSPTLTAGMVIATLLLVFPFTRMASVVFSKNIGDFSGKISPKIAFAVLYVAVAAYALLCAVISAVDFCGFTRNIMLTGSPALLAALPFLILCVWLAAGRREVLLKTALIMLPVIVISVIALFAASFPLFRYEAIPLVLRLRDGEPHDIWSLNSPLMKSIATLPAVLILLSMWSQKSKTQQRQTAHNAAVGAAAGIFLLSLCIIQVILIFCDKYIAGLDHPYLSAVSVISSDEVFLRMDGLVYLMFFVCSLIRTGASLMCISELLRKCGPRGEKSIPIIISICGAGVLVCCLVL